MSSKIYSHEPSMSKVLERQMRNWELARDQKPQGRGGLHAQVADFITITNNVGSGGGDVAHLLGEKLNWQVFDRQILTAMADDDEVRARLYESMDERDVGWVENTFRSFIQEEFRKNDYFHRLSQTILVLAYQGPAIFVGRSADLILPKQKGLRVKVYTGLDCRTNNFARRSDLSHAEAVREVERIDRERSDFVRKYFNRDVNDPCRFDLMINLERFTAEQATNLIIKARELRADPA